MIRSDLSFCVMINLYIRVGRGEGNENRKRKDDTWGNVHTG